MQLTPLMQSIVDKHAQQQKTIQNHYILVNCGLPHVQQLFGLLCPQAPVPTSIQFINYLPKSNNSVIWALDSRHATQQFIDQIFALLQTQQRQHDLNIVILEVFGLTQINYNNFDSLQCDTASTRARGLCDELGSPRRNLTQLLLLDAARFLLQSTAEVVLRARRRFVSGNFLALCSSFAVKHQLQLLERALGVGGGPVTDVCDKQEMTVAAAVFVVKDDVAVQDGVAKELGIDLEAEFVVKYVENKVLEIVDYRAELRKFLDGLREQSLKEQQVEKERASRAEAKPDARDEVVQKAAAAAVAAFSGGAEEPKKRFARKAGAIDVASAFKK